MKIIKALLSWLDDIWPIALFIGMLLFFLWFGYKIGAGLYHLLDKLIDKI